MKLDQIFEMINIGLITLDRDLTVRHWNRWMEANSGIKSEAIIGKPLFDSFANLDTPQFKRNCKAVFSFGNLSFFSQKLHRFLFPFKPTTSFGSQFEFMQQSCTMGPLWETDDEGKSEVKEIYIIVQDVTEIASYNQKLIELNVRDGLTGVFNRKLLDKRLAEEVDRHARYDRPLSMIMLDIDFFKDVNDTHGHQCGDYILKRIATIIHDEIRGIDFFGRYGGEEFYCIVPETNLKDTAEIAERYRQVIEKEDFQYGKTSIKVTISLGVAELTPTINTPELILKKADEALYHSKKTGRNKVSTSLDVLE